MPNYGKPPKERIKIARQIQALIAKGKAVPDACKELGISNTTYFRYRRFLTTKKTAKQIPPPTLTQFPITDNLPRSGNLIALVGAPTEVLAAIKQL